MRISLLATAALGLALAAPAFAQNAREPLPANPSSVQDGTPAAGTDTGKAPGQDPAARTNVPGAMNGSTPATNSSSTPGGMTTGAQDASPAPAQPGGTMAPPPANPPASADAGSSTAPAAKHKWHHHKMAQNSDTATQDSSDGHWAHQPGTGMSGPASDHASNIDSADTHSVIAPHFPTPPGGEDAGPRRYLRDATAALGRHRSGEADQALEMAETRILTRSTAANAAQQQDENPAIQQIAAARKAIAAKDWAGAKSAIQSAMNSFPAPRGGAMGEQGGAMGRDDSAMGSSGTGMSASQTTSTTSSGGMPAGQVVPTANSTQPAPLSGGMAGGAPSNPSGGAAGPQPSAPVNGAGGGAAGAAGADSAGGAK